MSGRAIETAVRKMAGSFGTDTVQISDVTVVSVDENAATCTARGDNGIEIPNIELQTGVCDGLLILPAKDSVIRILWSKNCPPCVVQFGDVDKYHLQVGDSSIEIANDGNITLNGGKNNGIIKIQELTSKLNNAINQISTELVEISTCFSALNVTYTPGALSTFSAGDYENKNVTH